MLPDVVYSFRIEGNQENRLGNPIPYLRSTQGSQWTDKARRYHAWQDYVCRAFCDATKLKVPIKISRGGTREIKIGKPLCLLANQHAVMNIIVDWANEAHADCDNVWKGIADALFENDKHLAGSFRYIHTLRKGFVDVDITISKSGNLVETPLASTVIIPSAPRLPVLRSKPRDAS